MTSEKVPNVPQKDALGTLSFYITMIISNIQITQVPNVTFKRTLGTQDTPDGLLCYSYRLFTSTAKPSCSSVHIGHHHIQSIKNTNKRGQIRLLFTPLTLVIFLPSQKSAAVLKTRECQHKCRHSGCGIRRYRSGGIEPFFKEFVGKTP